MKLFTVRRFALDVCVVAAVLAAGIATFGASSDVDPGFNPHLVNDLTSDYHGNVAFQPDGKIIIFGTYNSTGLVVGSTFIKRVNPDGTIDPTFDCPSCRGLGVGTVAVQPDGKILVGTANNRVIRVFSDGRLDLSYKPTFNDSNPNCQARFIIALNDGKSLVNCHMLIFPSTREIIWRLNDDGTVDPAFSSITLQSAPRAVTAGMILLPDGKILFGGGYGSESGGWIRRHNADGSPDITFQATPSGSINGVGLLADGRYLVTGLFQSINGVNKSHYATLFADGSVDTAFTAARASNDSPANLRTLPNGQFYVLTRRSFFPVPVSDAYRFVRHNSDGSIDNSFSQSYVVNSFAWEVDSQGRILTHKASPGLARFYRLNLDGSVDNSFNPPLSIHSRVSVAALQSDGKVIVAGEFLKANGVPVIRFVRLNPDGTNDPTFNSGTGFTNPPDTLAVQPDGKILAAGDFNGYNWLAQTKLVRINPDGSADASFTPSILGNVFAILPLADGKILIAGSFSAINGVQRAALARLNADGSLDGSYAPVFTASPQIFDLLLQPDGKLMASGTWNTVNGFDSKGIVRLFADGTVDTTFRADTSGIRRIERRSDGKYIVYSDFLGIHRFNGNGTRDFSFLHNASVGSVEALFLQPSGNIVYGGSAGINRIGPNGERDIYFPVYGANNRVLDILPQPDGKLIVAGWFSGIEDVGRHGIARLTLSNRIRGTAFDYDGDGRSDVSVYRPSTNTWYQILSGNGSIGVRTFGAAGDILTPADFDGDGKTDIGLYRPSLGDFLYIESSTNTLTQRHWGQTGDIPLPSDCTADGRADMVVYRPSTGTWFGNTCGSMIFGSPGDLPLIGDFDGDGKTDRAVFRPSTGDWWYAASSTVNLEHRQTHWGANGDLPVPADYDGDFKTDFAVFRPSDGGWYIYNSSDGSFTILAFGSVGDRPAPADYDGDGRADLAVFRPSTGIWYLYQTTSGFAGLQFGVSGDIPTPNAFVP